VVVRHPDGRRQTRQEMTRNSDIHVRRAGPTDAPTLHRLIHELAVYERLEHEAVGSADDLAVHMTGKRPLVEALIAEDEAGEPLGFTLTYTTFSTFLCRPGIHIEDLFVAPSARGRGVGGILFSAVAARAIEQQFGRLEWDVLDWNEPAIGFYRRQRARPVEGWTKFRLTGDDLAAAARGEVVAPDGDQPAGSTPDLAP
jgi:GNAT superfamily N-acetyltransferase